MSKIVMFSASGSKYLPDGVVIQENHKVMSSARTRSRSGKHSTTFKELPSGLRCTTKACGTALHWKKNCPLANCDSVNVRMDLHLYRVFNLGRRTNEYLKAISEAIIWTKSWQITGCWDFVLFKWFFSM